MSLREKLAKWLITSGKPPEVRQAMGEVIAAFNTVTAADWYRRNGYDFTGFGGYTSHTGKTVTQESSLALPAFYAGVKMIAEDMGSLPRHVYRYSKDWKATEKARDLRLYRVMHDLVNPDVSAGEFVEALTSHAILAGRGLAGIQRQTTSLRKSEIIYLWPWMPADCLVDKDTQGRTVYQHKEGGQWKTYRREEVFHLKGFTFTGTDGDDIISRACQALGLGLAQQEFAGRYFANGIHSDLFITHPGVGKAALGPEGVKLMKQAFAHKTGLDHVAEPFVLQEGSTAARHPVDMEKAQLVGQRKLTVLDVCRLLRLPPHKLAELDRAIQANIVEQSIEYVVYSLIPQNRRWREAFYRCLLTVDEQLAGLLYMEHDFAGLLRGDFAAQAEGFRAMLEKGVYSINEVRRILNLNPVPGGDEHYIQLNMQAVGQAASQLAGELTAGDLARMLNAKPDELKTVQEIERDIDLALSGLHRVGGDQ